MSGSVSYSFDGLVTHIGEVEASAMFPLSSATTLGGTIQYVDATQNSIGGIRHLRGQVLSGLADLTWHTSNHLISLDMHAGVDAILDWKVQPRVEGKATWTIPLGWHRLLNQVKLIPQGWYKHHQTNGPAIQNRIASYGYTAEAMIPFGLKGAASASLRQEYLSPANPVLDTSFLISRPGGVPFDTLGTNVITKLGAYIYYQVLTPLYLGYSFSFSDSRIDRRIATYSEAIIGEGFPPRIIGTFYQWKQYPYPTPQKMLAHQVTVALNIPITPTVRIDANGVIPIVSNQQVRYRPEFLHSEDRLENYPYQAERNTGTMTMKASVRWKPSTATEFTFTYDYFGFPYEPWAYFTKNSYSLHTFKTGIEKRF